MHQTLFYIPKEIAGISVFGVGWLLGIIALLAIGTTIYLAIRSKRGETVSDTEGASRKRCQTPFLKELFGYIPFWALLAVIVVWILPLIMKNYEGLPIRGYGVMLLFAIVAATLLNIWRGRRIGLTPDKVISLMFWAFVPGILGARIFFIIEYWDTFQHDTLSATLGQLMSITEGGLVVYGSIIGGLLGIIAFTVRNRLRFFAVADMLAPSLMLGIAIGRLGCLLNGCCFGGPCDHAWAVTFPQGSPPYMSQVERGQLLGIRFSTDPKSPPILNEVKPDSLAYLAGLRSGDQITQVNGFPINNTNDLFRETFLGIKPSDPSKENASKQLTLQTQGGSTVIIALPDRSLSVHPTQIYSSINAFIIFLFLLAISPFLRREGILFALVMTIYPITRFLLEIIRTDETAIFGTGLSISQNVSIILLVGIVGLWLYILTRKQPDSTVVQN